MGHEDHTTASDAMSITMHRGTDVDEALDAIDEATQRRAQKRIAARLAMDTAKRDYYKLLEMERMKTRTEFMLRHLEGRQQEIPIELCYRIIALHADGETLRGACEANGISRSSLWRQCEKSEELRAALAQAREHSAHCKLDDVYWIARTEPEVERAKLLADITRWEVSKVLPHLYGDKLKVESPDGVVFSIQIGQPLDNKGGSDK
jgi:hypothetical protein